jgi:hypothetical protein
MANSHNLKINNKLVQALLKEKQFPLLKRKMKDIKESKTMMRVVNNSKDSMMRVDKNINLNQIIKTIMIRIPKVGIEVQVLVEAEEAKEIIIMITIMKIENTKLNIREVVIKGEKEEVTEEVIKMNQEVVDITKVMAQEDNQINIKKRSTMESYNKTPMKI